jgi:S-formylglutathione hydrolase FrmB
MARKRQVSSPGRLVVLEHDSRVLRGNPLRDPHVRRVTAWLPPAYDGVRRFPVLFSLAGFIGTGPAQLNWKPFSENLPERLARLVHTGAMPPVIVVFPDCYTALGGNQYVNSSAVGRYADYLVKELVPFVDRELRTLPSRDHRGLFGKSSGGYGAMVHAMRHPGTWGAAANHSGDAYFDFLHRSDWPNTLDELAKYRRPALRAGAYDARRRAGAPGLDQGYDDGRVRRFLKSVWARPKLGGAESMALMNVAMAASYDPDPRAPLGFRLPMNLETGELIPARWRRWLANDPINLVGRHAPALRSLRALYLDCGWRDQFHIHYGSRILARRLAVAGVPHRYEEFDDNHSDIDYRLDVSLPYLARALSTR